MGTRPFSTEQCLPRIFLELSHQALTKEILSLRRVAEMLGINDIELEERLYGETEDSPESYTK